MTRFMLFLFVLVVDSVYSTNIKLFNIGRKPIPRLSSTTTMRTTTTYTTSKVTTVKAEQLNMTTLVDSIENGGNSSNENIIFDAPRNNSESTDINGMLRMDSNSLPYAACPSEPIAHIGKHMVMSPLNILTLVINKFSTKVDEYYTLQARFLQHINELIRTSIALSDNCVIKRRRWLYKTCVKEIVTQAKQASRQSIVDYEKIRKEAVWYANNGACSLEQLPLDIFSVLRKLAIDIVQAEFTTPAVENLIVECDKYCRIDPVVKNIIFKLNATENDRGNSYHFSNVIMKTDEERNHRRHSNQPKNSSQFISKTWS